MKRFIAILLVVLMLCGLVACAPAEQQDARFRSVDKFRLTTGYRAQLVYDLETKVMYIICGDSLCPYYDEDGNVMIYEGRGY